MSAPTLPTDQVFPDWTNLQDRWREQDAEWLRDRVVHLFDDAAQRDAVITAPAEGMCCYLKSTKEVYAYTGTAWAPVVLPDVRSGTVAASGAAPAGVAVMGRAAGSGGIVLTPDGAYAKTVKAETLQVQTQATGQQPGKVVALTTDATRLNVDSPVNVNGQVSGSSLAAATAAVSGAVTAGTVQALAVTAIDVVASSTVSGNRVLSTSSMVFGGVGEVMVDNTQYGVMAKLRHTGVPAAYVGVRADGWAFVNDNLHVSQGLSGEVRMRQPTGHVLGAMSGPTVHDAAGNWANVASVKVSSAGPSGNAPEGCIWVQV